MSRRIINRMTKQGILREGESNSQNIVTIPDQTLSMRRIIELYGVQQAPAVLIQQGFDFPETADFEGFVLSEIEDAQHARLVFRANEKMLAHEWKPVEEEKDETTTKGKGEKAPAEKPAKGAEE